MRYVYYQTQMIQFEFAYSISVKSFDSKPEESMTLKQYMHFYMYSYQTDFQWILFSNQESTFDYHTDLNFCERLGFTPTNVLPRSLKRYVECKG